MNRGFTVVELLVVLAMLAIVLALGVPAFENVVADNRITAESHRIVSSLNYARSEASSRAVVITLARKSAATSNWAQGWEIYTDEEAAGNSARVGADVFLKDIDAVGNGVTLNANTAANRWISFDPNGALNEGGNTVTLALCDGRGAASGRDININLAGRTTVSAPSADCTP